jgi:hypothetical protein
LQRGPGHRIPAAVRRRIERYLVQDPGRSDRQTAKLAGVAVDTVTRIRRQLEDEKALPRTRGRGGPGRREILSPRTASSLGQFLRWLPPVSAAYVEHMRTIPKVRVSLSLSYASAISLEARWTEDVESFIDDWSNAAQLTAVPDLATASGFLDAAEAALRAGNLAVFVPLMGAGSDVFAPCPGCEARSLEGTHNVRLLIADALRDDT